MKLEVNIPDYKPTEGVKTIWDDDAIIETKLDDNVFIISANSAGLTSLAYHLLTMAQNNVPSGSHIHYDEFSSLEENSIEFIISKA